MKIKHVLLSLLFCSALSFFLCGCSSSADSNVKDAVTPTIQPTSDITNASPEINGDTIFQDTTRFLHVEGNQIVDGTGSPVWLKGVSCTNNTWAFPDTPAWDSQDESSYADMASMGFNCVRFYMNYQVFENDTAPYTYKEDSFAWLDENIKWAKKNGIGIILNMHAPQGGYQSQGNGSALWTEDENQKRLIALWEEFAKRYADEDTVIGYGLINEPIVPEAGSVEASVEQCRQLMQKITDAIRKHDKNHIIFAERVCAIQSPSGYLDWNIDVNKLQFLLDDTNTVYEFHSYIPYNFTHQDMSWADTEGLTKVYPSDELMVSKYLHDWVNCTFAESIQSLENGWELYETSFASLTKQYNVGSITFLAANLGEDGVAYIDDIVLEEYKNGELTRVMNELDFTADDTDFSFWTNNGDGINYRSVTDGYTGTCYAIAGTTADANVSGYRFALKEGYEYKIRAKIKTENVSSDARVMPRIDFSLAEDVFSFNKEYLAADILNNLQFGIDHNVPMYLGEFGTARTSCYDERGGELWGSDMLDICKENNLHFNYHAYNEPSFGIYGNVTTELPTSKNNELVEVFINKLTK